MSSPVYTTDSQSPPPLPPPPPPRTNSKILACKWDECSETFIILSDLVSHLHDDHVGRKKANYTCEWASCPRKGATQTSRFALITHLRSHTGEKPYDCKVPGCEKSFTRPDSLTKHMKSQHTEPRKKRTSMEEPQRTNKKRKMSTSPEDEEDSQTSLGLTSNRSLSRQSSNNLNNNHNSNSNNSSPSRSKQQQALRHSLERQRQNQQNSSLRHQQQPSENSVNQNCNYSSDVSSLSEPSESSLSSPDNNNNNNNNNNNINNNINNNNSEESQQKSFYEKYLVLKAKHRYIRRENELLADEYQIIKKKLKRLKTEKDILLDAVMQQNGVNDDDGDGGDADI